MAGKFGFLARLSFLQDWASHLIAASNPAIGHNIEKYYALKKVHYLSAIEAIEGDYLEFGVFTGSSFCHSMRCCRAMAKLNPKVMATRFFGFDSFSGFGALDEKDRHPFYTDETFSTDFHAVRKRVQRVAKAMTFELVPGFFSESLQGGPGKYRIEKARIIFVDSDTYASSREALRFCVPIVQEGTFIVLDDYFSYRGSENRGVAKAFTEFLDLGSFKARTVFTYGMGGIVFVLSAAHT